MTARLLRAGEMLAIDASAIHRGGDGLFWLFGPARPASARHRTHDDIAMVHVRGPLEHHADAHGDSYEDILRRVECAMTGADACEEGASPSPPAAVMLCIDSPGGVVAGLNETVGALKRLRTASGVPLVAYVNEMAASAAYALACACDEILCPASAILGSIGTISTMISQKARDEAEGYDVRLITSGARKADGHAHADITDAAVEAERARVLKLAAAFYDLAGAARGLSVAKVQALQAAIFLGADAKARRLADAVVSLDEAASMLSSAASRTREAKGNETDRRMAQKALDTVAHGRSTSKAQAGTPELPTMPVALDALITKTEAALAAETSPRKKARLAADLAAYQLTRMRAEGSDDDEGDADDDEDEDKSAKKAALAKKKAEAAKHRAKAAEHKAKAAEYEDAASKCESGDDEEAEASASHAARAAADAASEARASSDVLTQRVASLEKRESDATRAQIIAEALGKRITPAQAKALAKEPLAYVRKYIEMAPKALLVGKDEPDLLPSDAPGGGSSMLPKAVLAEIDERVGYTLEAMGDLPADRKKVVGDAMRARLIDERRTALATNGIAGRV